jgi:hypothetical protein
MPTRGTASPTAGLPAKPLNRTRKRPGRGFFLLAKGVRMFSNFTRYAAAAALTLLSPGAAAQTLLTAIDSGRPIINVRLRYEDVDQSNRTEVAQALTVRARLGYQTGVYYGFSVIADFDFVQHLGAHDFCDTERDCTPATVYPIVPDPDLVALNRLQLSYAFALAQPGVNDTTIALGRQRLVFGNQRFVGNVGWRQHEQTYDAVSIVNTSLPMTTLTYAYVTQVNRVFGEDSVTQSGHLDGQSHLFNATYTGLLPYLRLEGFAYLLDLEQGLAPTAPRFRLSTASYGARAEGTYEIMPGLSAMAYASYALQRDYADNPLSIDLDYWLLEGALSYRGLSAGAGWEVLSGDGVIGFATPLATLHAFQGWADVFLTTPTQGIEDLYFRGGYTFPAAPLFNRVTASAIYHDYTAERMDADFGHEWNFLVEAALDDNVLFGAKYADYNTAGVIPSGAQTAAFDKRILWLYAQYVY